MRICDVEFYLAKVEIFEVGLCDRIVILRLQTDSGIEGWGEAPLPWRVLELPRRREQILPFLAGRNVLDIADLRESLSLPAPLRAAVEMACWDAAGKFLKQPVCRFFGGFFRRQVPLAEFVGSLDDDGLLEKAQRLYDKGNTWWLLRTSGEPSRDIEMLQRMRDQFGEAVELRLDGGKRFDFATAVHLCLKLQPLNLHCIIDPLATTYWETYHRLKQEGPFAIAVWRGVASMEAVWAVARTQAAQHVILDLHALGGLFAVRDAVALAHGAGMEVSLSVGCTLGFALAAVLHLGAALAPLVHAHNLWGPRDAVHCDLGSGGKDGMWVVPEEPGLGVEWKKESWDVILAARDS